MERKQVKRPFYERSIMNVYYTENFWGCESARDSESEVKNRLPGRKIPLNLRFCYAGVQFFVPALYRFPDGITMDVITLPDEQKDKERRRVYEEEYSSMNEEEKAVFEAQAEERLRLPIRTIEVNGIAGKLQGSCSGCWLPWEPDRYMETLREEYFEVIPEGREFVCMRFHADVRLLEDEVKSLNLYMAQTEKLLPVLARFETGTEDETGKELVSFLHPQTGVEHKLYLSEIERIDLEKVKFSLMDLSEIYALQIEFETVPPIEKGERMYLKDIHYYKKERTNRCCSVIMSTPRAESTEDMNGEESPGMQIIGGADGPTSIFLCGVSDKGKRKGAHGGEYDRFVTELTAQEQHRAKVAVVGIYIQDEPEQKICVQMDR